MNARKPVQHMGSRLENVQALRALFLSGSYGIGLEDAYSDIDFLAVVEEGGQSAFIEAWRTALTELGEIVLWRERKADTVLINTVLENWLRIDVVIITEAYLADWSKRGLKTLIDHDALAGKLSDAPADVKVNIAQVQFQFEEFIRILGLLPVAIGRQDYVTGVTGIMHLRDLLIKLLIEETGVADRGGNLHLNRLITPEQQELLQALPPLTPTREAVIAANLAYAAAYLPRARQLAQKLDIDWPQQFEDATWRHLLNALGVGKSY